MYLENQSNLEIEMSQTPAQSHQARNSLRSPEAVAGNFGELRLLQDISQSRETQKLQQAAVLPAGQCVIHAEGFVPVRQEDGYVRFCSHSSFRLKKQTGGTAGTFERDRSTPLCFQPPQGGEKESFVYLKQH